MVKRLSCTERAEKLFDGWQETMVWSCLQNVMGDIYVTDQENPESALAVLGQFYYFAGVPDRELVLYKPQRYQPEFRILVPQNEGWTEMIAGEYGSLAERFTRYAVKKEPDIFEWEMLQKAVDSLSDEYTLKMIDEKLFEICRESEWSCDFVSQYADYEMFQGLGIGVLALKDGVPVSGASSYSSYREGIEVEVDTREEYRRRGLAYACAAKLILECRNRKLYPSWDAHNMQSVALAEKLGYHYDHEYTAFSVSDPVPGAGCTR